ncbi:MAG: division/cell wall cluster transcriptional repressor MraZ [Spirochaetes bacterium]|nr:division/cell wall cluster transcriptional repressor MraZ [Spirochaetota bacterium]
MFKGTFFHTLDDKGRIAMPNKLRQQIEKSGETEILIITQGFEGCLLAYPQDQWKMIEEKASKLSLLDEDARNFIRFFISPASECVLDKMGRIILPTNLREYGQIQKEVVISGALDKIEIWSKKNYDDYWREFKDSKNDVIKQMKDIGL